ncbi:MAG: phenylacetate--CoA ligase family protein [Anaerolineae bacterium]|nr:phenylacetate--CoA ligase family protein [Anaerolineae bacterium]
MAGVADQIYRAMPVPLQHLMVSAYGIYWHRLRFGGTFEEECAGFRRREGYTAEQWQEDTTQRLRLLLLQAFDRAPYYQQAWKGLVTREDLERFTPADLTRLPVLEKKAVRDDPVALLLDGAPLKQHTIQHTSGSTGTPIKAYWLPEELRRSLALRETRSCGFAGVSYRMPRATFSGRIVEPNPDSSGPFYRFNMVERQVYFSAFHLSPKNVPLYLRALERHHIQWVTGYANSIYQLAQLAEDGGHKAPSLKAVITTSEKITPEMRAVVERVFQTKVYEEYGTVEDLMYACDCQHGRKHISPDAGIIEIVDEALRPVPAGQPGEVLATGFIRPHQPMVRYRVGDIAIMDDQPCPCGRQMPVLKEVVGRVEDTVYGVDGRRMVRFHGVFVNQPHVYEGQIVQEALNRIRVRVVPKPGFGDADRADIVQRIQQRLTDQMQVEIDLVESIERTKAGKFKAVVSQLSPEDLKKVKP